MIAKKIITKKDMEKIRDKRIELLMIKEEIFRKQRQLYKKLKWIFAILVITLFFEIVFLVGKMF